MLTSTGYIVGLVVYALSALLALILFNFWFLRGQGVALRVLLSLPCAALLLTPAYIQPGAETLAPALVVFVFQWFGQGPEEAQHALQPLLLFTGIAVVLGVITALFVVWRRRGRDSDLDISGER